MYDEEKPINLSILDFKYTFVFPNGKDGKTINLSILDFKLAQGRYTTKLLSTYKSIHIGF